MLQLLDPLPLSPDSRLETCPLAAVRLSAAKVCLEGFVSHCSWPLARRGPSPKQRQGADRLAGWQDRRLEPAKYLSRPLIGRLRSRRRRELVT